MNISKTLTHSYPCIKYYARCMCTKIHQSRSNHRNKTKHVQTPHNNKIKTYPRRFSAIGELTEEQKTLIIEHLLTHRNPANVLYSEKQMEQTTNAYISNLIIDMVYSTYCETGEGIALYDTQFEMKWKQFIVRKFSKLFSGKNLTQIIETLCVLPPHLSNYTRRIKHFIFYEYDRISFKKPVYIFPCDSFMANFTEFTKHNKFNNTLHKLHDQQSPFLRRNKLYKYSDAELYHRISYLFEKNMYKNGLYLHELASVFEQAHDSVLSFKSPNADNNVIYYQKGVESLALNPYFESYYISKFCFTDKVSLETLIENAGCLYCDNKHISRVMIFGNHSHGRYQHALLTILKNDDYLHTFQFVKTKMRENYPDLYNELDFERQNEVTFTRIMLQRFGPLLHIYRIPTIDRYNEEEPRTKIKTDLYDLRYQRRYMHCLNVFHERFNERIYDLVRAECMKRMMLYDKSDFVIGNNGIRISEFESLWHQMYPYQMFPFQGNEYALFYHLIEFQSHNIRALPINNMIEKEDMDSIEFSGTLIPGSNLLVSARSLYNRAQKMYYYSYQFVPVQPYNNQTHQRLVDTMGVLQREFYHKKPQSNAQNVSKAEREIKNIQQLKQEYTQNISYLLKTFRNDGIPLCDFARLFEYKYHNISASGSHSAPLLSFNPDIISIQIDSKRNLLNVGDIHRSLSNILVVWGALITPKTKPIQQQLLFPLKLGVMNWMTLTSLDYYNHKSDKTAKKNANYSVAWNEVKSIGQHINDSNSLIHKHRNQLFGVENTPKTKLWIIRDTDFLKQQSFYKFASNITLSHKYIHSEQELSRFWPNHDSNISLFRRPVAPIYDYDMLTLHTLYQSTQNNECKNRNAEFKNIAFYKFIDDLMEKYSKRMKNKVAEKTFLFDYLSLMSMRIIHILSTYIDEYSAEQTENQVDFIRWSTFMNRYETLFGRMIVPSFDIDRTHNVIFGIFSGLHCNIVDVIGSKDYVENYLVKHKHFSIPSRRGMNQLMIQFPKRFMRKYLSPKIAPNRNIRDADLSIKMNKFHKQFVPISFLLSSQMLHIKKYNNLMMSADINKMDTNWKKSDSFYALSMDPLTRNTVSDIVQEEKETGEIIELNDKFQRLLSRRVYCIATMREVLSGLSDAEWNELSTTNIRHILDGFVMRGEVTNAYKILMVWFRDKLANRFDLYSYLLSTYLNDNNLSMSYEIYQYLQQMLYTKYDDRANNDDYYYEAQMLTYCCADCSNKLLNCIIQNGHFYLFDEMIENILKLKEKNIVSSIDTFISHKHLCNLLKTLSENEFYSRLLPLIAFIKYSNTNNISMRIIHAMCELFKLQQDDRLHGEIVDIMWNVHCSDNLRINWYKILAFVIQNRALHFMLNHAEILNIYSDLATKQSYSNIIELKETETLQIIDAYCSINCAHTLSRNAWKVIMDWMLATLANNINSNKKYINDMIYYFCINECLPCLICGNYGDAIKWSDLCQYILMNHDIIHKIDDTLDSINIHDMNGFIILLQIIATLNDFNSFSHILNKLSASTNRLITEHYAIDIIDCFMNDNVRNLNINQSKDNHSNLLRAIIKSEDYHKLNHITKELNIYKKNNKHLKAWIESINKYQSLLQIDSVHKNTEFKQNVYDELASM